jgi:hypothetical protein
LRARAAWQFGAGPDYCRGCAAIGRDCGSECPFVANAPQTLSGAICWEAGMLCVEAGMAGPTIALAPALAIAGEQRVTATVAASLLGAMREGIATAKPSGQEPDA